MATALAAAVMAAILAAVARMARQQDLRPGRWDDPGMEDRLLAVIECDLANARTVQTIPDGVRLEGLCGLDPGSRGPDHRPATVAYRVVRLDGQPPWLVRQEFSAGPGGGVRTSGELVCRGVERFSLAGSADPAGQASDVGSAARPIPEVVRATLVLAPEAGRPRRTLTRVFFLR